MSLYEREAAVRQAQLVIDWLEKNSEEQLEDYYEKVEFFTDQSGSWYVQNEICAPPNIFFISAHVKFTN